MTTSSSDLQHVWQPLDIGPTRVKHRLMMTAQTILYSDDHILGDRHIAFYRERAMGGVALLLTEQQAAHRLSKGSFFVGCTAWEKRVIPQYAKLADAVHEHGCKQFVQLFACGVHDKGTTIFDEWHPLWAASRVPSIVHREVPLEMDRDQVLDIVKGYGESAVNVQVSGLDGVEIHGAHSYLVGQFLSRAYNRRTDEYGGSVENRARLPLQIAEEIRSRVGDEITVGIRLTFDEYMGDAGITPEETEETLELLASSGLFDYFNISGGGYHTLHVAVAPMNVEQGVFVPFGERAKDIVGDRAKVFIVGRIVDAAMADEIVRDGKADMVAMTRAQMADPYLVTKLREDRSDEIVRCIGANVCLSRAFDQREVACVMNPAVGRERELGEGTLQHVNGDARDVIVVGGGPSGMRTAATAARRGHRVKLFEAADELGGHLNTIKEFPTRGSWTDAIGNLARPLERHGVDVQTGTCVTAADLADMGADAVVVATGSTWDDTGFSAARPEREGIPRSGATRLIDLGTAAREVIQDPKGLGSRVLIVDESAIYLPLGVAEVLADAGVEVEIISPQLFVGEEALKTMDLFYVYPRLKEKNVRLTPQHFVESVGADGVTLYHLWGGEPRVEWFDTVVLAQMRQPIDEIYRELRDSHPDVRRVGDALTPRSLSAVIYEGEEVARAL